MINKYTFICKKILNAHIIHNLNVEFVFILCIYYLEILKIGHFILQYFVKLIKKEGNLFIK